MQVRLPRIWIITNPEHAQGPVTPLVRALEGCPAGAVGVQLRAHGADDRELVAWGRALRAATSRAGCPLTVNRRPDVAEILGADGVHLPESGLSVRELRSTWPDIQLVGASRHDRSGLLRAAEEQATFAFLSPVYAVPGKAEPMGVEGFAAQIAGVEIPTYALGGVGVADVAPLIAAGAKGIAVRRAIYDALDPKAALDELLRELDKTSPKRE
jgi:thiamine-phosphate pyrophosphorylase